MRRANQRGDDAWLGQNLNKERHKERKINDSSPRLCLLNIKSIFRNNQNTSHRKMIVYNLWIKLAREMLRHSHAGRVGLKLLLVEHAVYLTGLAARRGGAGPAW